MKILALAKIKGYLRAANQWFSETPERALEQAYDAALRIKAIEDEYFQGEKISPQSNGYSDNVSSYFQAELKKYLKTARVRLTEFRASNSFVITSDGNDSTDNGYLPAIRDKPAAVLEKLQFVDSILERYSAPKTRSLPDNNPQPKASIVVVQSPDLEPPNASLAQTNNELNQIRAGAKTESYSEKTGLLPRSILRTVDRVKRELDPKAEEEVVKNFRGSKNRTIISLRFILLLILIPILTQQISKTFLVGPIIDYLKVPDQIGFFLNYEMEERAFHDLQIFEERLRFENLIQNAPPLAPEVLEERVRLQALEIANEYRRRGASAIKNVFADIFALAAFGVVIYTSKREISVLKSFIDEIVYGLSDSAKAFIIILFTDMFVGFHSPHGWEVILEGIANHLGVPASRDFIFLFIATFPVILDTVFKYWIFRYLNRISPSAVATYRNMNE